MSRFSFLVAFTAAAFIIVLSWWWLGQPISISSDPLAADEGARIPCVSYAPFRRGQTPFDPEVKITTEQIEEDIAALAKVADCVRTYSVELGLDQVPAIAKRHGMKVILGIWIGGHADKNASEIEKAVATANAYADTVRLLVVGNEVLLRGELSPTAMRSTIAGVKARVSVPVTYAEVWEFWNRNPGLADVVDVITIHVLPYWEDHPLPAPVAAAHLESIYRQMAETFPGKPLLVGEVGWPSKGRQRDASRATLADQALVLHEVLGAARRNGFDINLIEAFDQPWKRELEGTVGGYWGIFDADSRAAKFTLGSPVSNHRLWPWMAVAGIGIAAFVLGAGFWASGGMVSRRRLAVLAGLAAIAGVGFGLAVEQANFVERDRFAPLISLAVLVLAIVGPVVLAAALGSEDDRLSFAALIGRAEQGRAFPFGRIAAGVTVAAALLATAVALGLVFDPRYREFLTAGLAATVVGILALRYLNARPPSAEMTSEKAFAFVLAVCAVFIALHEGVANLQAIGFCAVLLILAIGLLGGRGGQSSGSAARPRWPTG